MKLDRDTYLLYNKELNTMAHRAGVEFCRQFSYNGPKVRRTKFWACYRCKANIDAFIAKVKRCSFVKDAFIYVPYNSSPVSVKVIYE